MQLLKDSGCLIGETDIASITCIPVIFQNVIFWLLTFAGIVALFLIIFSGIKFITSGGDPKQLEGAKKTLTFAIVGLFLILFSFLIINVISQVTNVGCIKFFNLTNCQPSFEGGRSSSGRF